MRWAVAIFVLGIFLVACSGSENVPELPNTPGEIPQQKDASDWESCDENRGVVCDSLWNPVCGEDGITYTNECIYCSNSEVMRFEIGECEDHSADVPLGAALCNQDRPESCVDIVDNVCGSDGKTYTNSCFACMNLTVSHTVVGPC